MHSQQVHDANVLVMAPQQHWLLELQPPLLSAPCLHWLLLCYHNSKACCLLVCSWSLLGELELMLVLPEVDTSQGP
jgi:hypothetical protein